MLDREYGWEIENPVEKEREKDNIVENIIKTIKEIGGNIATIFGMGKEEEDNDKDFNS